MAQRNLFGRPRRVAQVPPTVSRDGSTAPRKEGSPSRRSAAGGHVAAHMRSQNEHRSDPVRHARADAARARGSRASRYGRRYGTLNPRDEAQAVYADKRRRSSRMRASRVIAGIVIILIVVWLAVTLIGSCSRGAASNSSPADAQTTVTGTMSVN